MPKWALAATAALVSLLLTLVGWLLSFVFTSLKVQSEETSKIVYQVRQDVAVLSSKMETNKENCKCKGNNK